MLTGCTAGGLVAVALVFLGLYLLKRRHLRKGLSKGCPDPEKQLPEKRCSSSPAKELAPAEPHRIEVAHPDPAVVCKSVFADSALPDSQTWVLRDSLESQLNLIAADNPCRLVNASRLKEGISAPAPVVKGKCLEGIVSAEPPAEVRSDSNKSSALVNAYFEDLHWRLLT